MNKRFFGLDDLAAELNRFTPDDKSLQDKCLQFISDTSINNGIENLFNSKYGIRKTGHNVGQAGYFLTNYKFPIYDTLAKRSYSLLRNKYPELNMNDLNDKFDNSYFYNIRNLNIKSTINNYNKLDNLLWVNRQIN